MREKLGAMWPWVAAAVSGLLVALAYAPFNQGWLIWVALTPLMAALWLDSRHSQPRSLSWKRMALLGWVAGLVMFGLQFFWITTVTGIGWVAVTAYLALYPAAWAAITGVLLHPARFCGADGKPAWLASSKNLLIAAGTATAWCALEWLRGMVFTGFSWNGLGVALHTNPFFIQFASLTGVGGLSWMLVLMNSIALATVKRVTLEVGRISIRPHYDFNLAIALVVGVFTYGIYVVGIPVETVTIKIAAVQPNIPQDEKWDPEQEEEILQRFQSLSDVAAATGPDLMVWPEAATPRGMFGDQRNFDFVADIADLIKGDFILGTLDFDEGKEYNAAVMVNSQTRKLQSYHKLHLVPFGEYLPLRGIFPPFEWIAGELIPRDFSSGEEVKLFTMNTPALQVAPLICFEDTVARLVRRFAARGAQLMVNITNDGWFLESSASRQHLANAVFRSAETRLPMVRCANTGVTAIIDHRGRVTQELAEPETGKPFMQGVLSGTVDVPVRPVPTFHTRYGELFSIMTCLATLVFVVVGVTRNYRQAHPSTLHEKPVSD